MAVYLPSSALVSPAVELELAESSVFDRVRIIEGDRGVISMPASAAPAPGKAELVGPGELGCDGGGEWWGTMADDRGGSAPGSVPGPPPLLPPCASMAAIANMSIEPVRCMRVG